MILAILLLIRLAISNPIPENGSIISPPPVLSNTTLFDSVFDLTISDGELFFQNTTEIIVNGVMRISNCTISGDSGLKSSLFTMKSNDS